jgi:DNA polymerase/3'-5' exonuclease PolX
MWEERTMDNRTIEKRLRQHAQVLDTEGGNLYRVRAYRRAADLIAELAEPLVNVLHQRGRRGLRELPGIGSHIAKTIEQLIRTEKQDDLAATSG